MKADRVALQCVTGLLALVFALLVSAGWAEQNANSENLASRERPARLLLIASDASDPVAKALVAFLEETYPVNVNAIDMTDFTPLIDERIYDGFVYLGQEYDLFPSQTFLSDMSRTSKPLLWINYHAWGLDPEAQERLGMTFLDQHDISFTKVFLNGVLNLGETDTSLVDLRGPARELYRLYNDDLTVSIPGAVVSGNVTYVSYLPAFTEQEADLAAFRAAADAAFLRLEARAPAPRTPAERLAAAKADVFRDGVQFPYVFDWGETEVVTYDADSLHQRLLLIKDAGAEWLTINQSFFQVGKYSSKPEMHEIGTASYSALENIARDAHAIGLLVRLSIVVNLTKDSMGPNDWRGMIRPKDAEAWWQAYRDIVLRAAVFAQSAGIESLNLGTELNAMQVDDEQWRALADDVRGIAGFKGLVGYQVNYNAMYNMTWGDALDYLSIAAYWPLAERRDPSLDELSASWDAVGAELAEWSEAHPGVKLEFGEIGYVSQPYTAMFPFSWKPNRAGRLNLTEQLNCYIALLDFLTRTPAITGIGIFASTQYDLVADDTGYTPFGKPAEAVARRLMNLR